MSAELKECYIEHKLEDVMQYFISGLRLKEGVVVNSEWRLDTIHGVVTLKLFIDDSKIVTLNE